MRQVYIKKIMMKSKRFYFFSKEMLVMKMKKMHLYPLNMKTFMRIQELKTMKNNYLTFLELYIINMKKS